MHRVHAWATDGRPPAILILTNTEISFGYRPGWPTRDTVVETKHMAGHTIASGTHPQDLARFRQFLLWDIVVSGLSCPVILTMYLLFASPFLLIMMVEIAVNACLLLWVLRRVGYGSLDGPITAVGAGLLVISATLGLLAPVVIPIAVLLTVLAVILALPYVTGRTLVRLIVGAVIVSALITPFQLIGGPFPLAARPRII